MFEISRVQPAEYAEFGNEPRASARWRLRHVAIPNGAAFVRHLRAAACKGTHDADLRDASGGPSPGEAAARRSLWDRTLQQARSRADGPATIRSSPPPGGGCGLPVLMDRNLPRNTLPMTGLLRLLAKSLIKDSKRKIKRCCYTNTNSFSGRSQRRDGTSGCELRASAGRRPATPWRRRRALRRLRPEPESSFALFQHNGPQHRKYAFHGPQPVKSSS